ncbi:MAG: HAD-IB family hydrolase [Bacteroidales bacterium]|nr:HAD-IB family hydrolase [Bacteroidales bacterium]
MPNLVVFDFDGTITRKDTMLALAQYRCGLPGFLAGMVVLSPWLLMHVLGIYPNHRTKERFLTFFFGGTTVEEFGKLCQQFIDEKLEGMLRSDAIKCLKQHKEAGDRVLVVTASAGNWVMPWCIRYGVECIASSLEVKEGKITGRMDGKNCYGEEKVRRLLEKARPGDYDALIVYGDSRGDSALGKMADKYFYRNFA